MRVIAHALLLTLALTAVPTASASAAPAVRATGDFTADVDFASLTATPKAKGKHCELEVAGALTFDGTLSGVAEGTTTAYVLASCDRVLAAAPGTYRDVFEFSGQFSGTVAGTSTTGALTYAGVTHPGGEIVAAIRLRASSSALLSADATVAEGGSYAGVARP